MSVIDAHNENQIRQANVVAVADFLRIPVSIEESDLLTAERFVLQSIFIGLQSVELVQDKGGAEEISKVCEVLPLNVMTRLLDKFARLTRNSSDRDFGKPYICQSGLPVDNEKESGLLIVVQSYSKLTLSELRDFAIGMYGYEFRAAYPLCFVISIDLGARVISERMFLLRDELWLTADDLRRFNESVSRGGGPRNSAFLAFLLEKMNAKIGSRSDDLLTSLCENEDVARYLADRFEPEILERISASTSGDEGQALWFELFVHAQSIARLYKADETGALHLLMAILQNSDSRAYRVLGDANMDLDLVKLNLADVLQV